MNGILEYSGLDYNILSLSQCNSKLLLDLYTSVTGSALMFDPGLDEKDKCQVVVDALERHLPAIKLDHIQGSSLASKEELALTDLLNVFLLLWNTTGMRQSTLHNMSGKLVRWGQKRAWVQGKSSN